MRRRQKIMKANHEGKLALKRINQWLTVRHLFIIVGLCLAKN